MTGKFICFEGGEGAGKTSTLRHCYAELRAKNVDVIMTREPGGTPFGEKLRSLVLADGSSKHDHTTLLCMLAARFEHLHELILPALAKGTHVLCDRFDVSTWAYQASKISSWYEWQQLQRLTGHHEPDAYVFMDVPPEVGLRRRFHASSITPSVQEIALAQPPETLTVFDKKDLAFHEDVYECARYALSEKAKEGGLVFKIDARKPLLAVQRIAYQDVAYLLGAHS